MASSGKLSRKDIGALIISTAPKKLAVGKRSKTRVEVKKSKNGNLHKLLKSHCICMNGP
jgi:hypothetical protein